MHAVTVRNYDKLVELVDVLAYSTVNTVKIIHTAIKADLNFDTALQMGSYCINIDINLW